MKLQLQKLMLVGFFGLFLSTSASAAEYLTVTTDNANVRTGAGTNYPSSMELFQGYPLKVVNKVGEWYQISDYENDSGWIHKSIVKKCDTVIVNSDKSVNMRNEPSTESPVVADVERGVVMTVLATKGKWTQVRHGSGTTGWIYNPLLWP
jgi:SH3-like domain-containing protein